MNARHYSPIDHVLMQVDTLLTTLFGTPSSTGRPPPDGELEECDLSDSQRRLSSGLMRVNHTGEVCAQALYQGQAIMCRDDAVRGRMQQAAAEENDHLLWCQRRLRELDSHTSYLNPLWYLGSLTIGMTAGVCGDRWSLGFLAETEYQVVRHLDDHLQRLPVEDLRSRAIVTQMKTDEGKHADNAMDSGAAQLPKPVKTLMTLQSRVMTTLAYWV